LGRKLGRPGNARPYEVIFIVSGRRQPRHDRLLRKEFLGCRAGAASGTTAPAPKPPVQGFSVLRAAPSRSTDEAASGALQEPTVMTEACSEGFARSLRSKLTPGQSRRLGVWLSPRTPGRGLRGIVLIGGRLDCGAVARAGHTRRTRICFPTKTLIQLSQGRRPCRR